MVLTNPSNVDAYASLNPHFPAAFAALREMAAGNCPTGRYPVLEDTVFINVLEYDTHPAQGALMEVHRSYIDVMWVVSGQEQIGICPVEEMAVTKAYDPAGDAALGTLAEGSTTLRMVPGSVCILFPEDAHAPGLDAPETNHVRKLIAKVRVV